MLPFLQTFAWMFLLKKNRNQLVHITDNNTKHNDTGTLFYYDRFYCDTIVCVGATAFYVVLEILKVMAGPDVTKTLLYTLNNLLQQEKYKAVLAVVKGFRNGAV